ncbi:hypothetical protein AB9K34_02455 [Sedimentitalea sp. XS_ASV28]|uniref:hypothetical protein n=1 Tax=Sedimentitalea sp. XS_ASV28 TaxID=3241296 RepID=UPI003513BF2F
MLLPVTNLADLQAFTPNREGPLVSGAKRLALRMPGKDHAQKKFLKDDSFGL